MPLTTSMVLVSPPCFMIGQVGRALAVHANDVVLDLVGVLRLAHIAHRDPARTRGLDGDVIDVVHFFHQAVRVDVIVVWPDLHVTCRQNQVVLVHRFNDVHQAQLPREQLVRIDVHHRLAVFAAERRRDFCAFHHGNLVADSELADVVQLRLRQTFAL